VISRSIFTSVKVLEKKVGLAAELAVTHEALDRELAHRRILH